MSRFGRSRRDLLLRAAPSLLRQRAPGLMVARPTAILVDNALKHGALTVVTSLTREGDMAGHRVRVRLPFLRKCRASEAAHQKQRVRTR